MIHNHKIRAAIHPKLRGGAFYLCFFFSMGSFFPFLNIYFQKLGFTGQQIGILSMFIPVMSLFISTPVSALADRKKWRISILLSAIILVAIFIFLLRYPEDFEFVVINMLILAAAFSPLLSIADSLIVNMADSHRISYGSMRLWGSIGFAASATVFGIVWQRFQLPLMFITASVLMIPLFLSASILDEGTRREQKESESISPLFKDPVMIILILLSFLMGIPNALSISYEGILMTSLGGGNMLVGMIIGIAGIGEIYTMQNGEAIARRLHGANTIILALILMGIANFGYSLAWNPWFMIPMAALKGLSFGLFFTNIVRMVNDRAPENWVSAAQSLRAVAMFGLAQLIAGPLGGYILDDINPSAIFLIGGMACVIAVIVVWYSKQRQIFV
jgi:PPP family 3-phenylpropionic acid transporter